MTCDVTGATAFDTGTINDTGTWRLEITRVYLSGSKTNQLHFAFQGATTRILGFHDASGNNDVRLRCLATVANGDVKVRAITGATGLRY